MLDGAAVERAYLWACRAELAALKPGNVHVHAAGHDMTMADFEVSAQASAPAMAAAGLSVGQRILEAISRTRSVVASNTNLGIVLLSAPLAQAALSARGPNLRQRLERVLDDLTIDDAEQAFAAIRLANPGGLGRSAHHDVRYPPTATLRAAMEEARGRDRIAAQYSTGFADIFEIGLLWLAEGRQRWPEPEWATTAAYLAFLAAFPDSHILRKFDGSTAHAVMEQARTLEQRFRHAADPRALLDDLRAFDRTLKDKGINPGTCADLTVATLFASQLE
jgi:triphosphoribosyl-dephospho-CoA synthase